MPADQMRSLLWTVAIPSAAIILMPVAHVFLSRTLCRTSSFVALFLAVLLSMLFTLGISILTYPLTDTPIAFVLANAAIVACGSYIYFHFHNMGETARRIRILRELDAARRPMSFEEISSRYNAEEVIARRVQRLIDSAQVRLVDGRYMIAGRSILLMANAVNFAHQVVFGSSRKNIVGHLKNGPTAGPSLER